MNKWLWSAKKQCFFIDFKVDCYAEAGFILDDLVAVETSFFEIFSGAPPEGKVRGVKNGMPCWVDDVNSQEDLINRFNDKRMVFINDVSREIEILDDAKKYATLTSAQEERLIKLRKYRVKLYNFDVYDGDNELPVFSDE
ncbi:MAG: tail fiber assembly protein [Shewanella sp.]